VIGWSDIAINAGSLYESAHDSPSVTSDS
jgi:hypothetical protein